MPEFDGVDLTESYVLGWGMHGDDLRFDLELALVPGHPAYTLPKPDERTCWHPGTLTFLAVRSIRGLDPQDQVRSAIDADDKLDYGNIDTFEEVAGEYRLSGDFGDVLLESNRPRIHLT
jgi:hypothetical protein